MKKNNFKGLMENTFKRNSNKKVIEHNRDLVFPKLTHEDYKPGIFSLSLTPGLFEKLEELRGKYKLSRSAIIRILLDNVEV